MFGRHHAVLRDDLGFAKEPFGMEHAADPFGTKAMAVAWWGSPYATTRAVTRTKEPRCCALAGVSGAHLGDSALAAASRDAKLWDGAESPDSAPSERMVATSHHVLTS